MPSQAPRQIEFIVGDNIRAARVGKGWRQRHLSQSLDMDVMNVSRWERGKVMPSLRNLARIAAALEVPVDWLLEDHAQEEAA